MSNFIFIHVKSVVTEVLVKLLLGKSIPHFLVELKNFVEYRFANKFLHI